MGHVTGDRVLETTNSTGTGNITLAGAVSGYRAFSSIATADGDTFYYTIALGSEWECGLGTRLSATSFARTTVTASSTGSAVSFSAGVKEVWMDIPARLVQQFMPSINPNFINGKIVESHVGNAVTYAVKTLGGNNPSAADPVIFVFGAVDGTSYVRVVTAALSITIAAGATMGALSGKGFRIWLAAIDASGTVELVVRNCCDQTTGSIRWFVSGGENRISTTVQAGAGDDSALVSYSVTARTQVPYTALGNYSYTSLSVAGTWDVSPATINLFSRNMPRPGDVVQTVRADFTAAVNIGSSSLIYSDTSIATITPTSVANMIVVSTWGGTLLIADQDFAIAAFRLRNNTQSLVIGGDPQTMIRQTRGTAYDMSLNGPSLYAVDFPSSVAAQTYTMQVANTKSFVTSSNFTFNAQTAHIVLDEIMT